MTSNKDEIITFKVDESLYGVLKTIPNRSEFIRSAILAALESACPLCMGTGILSPRQKKHWETFANSHRVSECGECHELALVCENETGAGASPHYGGDCK